MSQLLISLDDGNTYQPVTGNVRLIYDDLDIPGEDEKGELHVNFTHEGIITDIWMDISDDQPAHNLATESVTIEERVEQLVEHHS